MARSAPRVAPQHNHAKCALRSACSVGGRPTLYEAKGARVAHHESRTWWPLNLKVRAANPPRCKCGRVPAGGLARSAPRVRPQHNHAKSTLNGACSVGCRPKLNKGVRAPQDSEAVTMAYLNTCCGPVAMMVQSSSSQRLGEEHASRCATTQLRQVHASRRMLRGRSTDTPRADKQGGVRHKIRTRWS